jgi:hypothetical protein
MSYVYIKCERCRDTHTASPDNFFPPGTTEIVKGQCLPCQFDDALLAVVDHDTANRIKASMNTAGLLLATHPDYGESPHMKRLEDMTDDEFAAAWKAGELVVTDADEETRKRMMAALDAIERKDTDHA